MNIFYIFSSSLFFLWIIREIFFWLYVWQHNEYRFDRFKAYFRSRRLKRKFIFSRLFLFKIILFFSYGVFILFDQFVGYYQYAVFGVFIFQTFILGKEIFFNTLKKPRLEMKTGIIMFLSVTLLGFFFAIPLLDRFFWLLFLDLAIPFTVALFVLLLSFPAEVYSDWQLGKALKKLRSHKKLLVIGVTGSVGKSQTKDYIYQILEKKFQTIRTHGHDNTAQGISETILKKLTTDTKIFVCEMSAYQRGEIKSLTQFIRPKIGVLTGVNTHYLSLFKSLDNLLKTNYELVESLPKDGVCLFNGSNKFTYTLFKKSKKHKVLFGAASTKRVTSFERDNFDIVAFNVVHKGRSLSFDLILKKKTFHLVTHVKNHVEYLLPAIWIADYLGMSESEIKKAVSALR